MTGIYVKSVVPGSPAAQCQKLRLGDRILAVNGVSLVGMDYQTWVYAHTYSADTGYSQESYIYYITRSLKLRKNVHKYYSGLQIYSHIAIHYMPVITLKFAVIYTFETDTNPVKIQEAYSF